jgi:hypothetical protein
MPWWAGYFPLSRESMVVGGEDCFKRPAWDGGRWIGRGVGSGAAPRTFSEAFCDLALFTITITINEKVKFMRMWRWSSASYSKLYGLIFAVWLWCDEVSSISLICCKDDVSLDALNPVQQILADLEHSQVGGLGAWGLDPMKAFNIMLFMSLSYIKRS